jgi:hypothetical protein
MARFAARYLRLGATVLGGALVALGLSLQPVQAQTFECNVDGGPAARGLHQCYNFSTPGQTVLPGAEVVEFFDCGADYIVQEHNHNTRGAPFNVVNHVFEEGGQITRSRFQNVGGTPGVVWLTGECRSR